MIEASPRFPLPWKIVLTDRNRGDLRMIAGDFSWRYRNRLSVERAVFIHSYAFTPYAPCRGILRQPLQQVECDSADGGRQLSYQETHRA